VHVVGVVGDVKNNELNLDTEPEVYLHAAAVPMNPVYFVVRSRMEPATLVPLVRRAVLSVDKTQAIYDVKTMRDIILASIGTDRLRSYLIAFFASSALLMAVIGIYGVVSYSVRNRTVEIGTRLAVGAQRSDVMRLVIGDGLKMALWGIVAGGVAVTGAALLLRSEVFGLKIDDPRPFLYSTAVVAAFTSLACAFPAWRAMLLTPIAAIRDNAGWIRHLSLPRRRRVEDVDVAEGVLLAEFVEASRTAASFREAIGLALNKVREVLHASSASVIEKDAIAADGLLAGRFRHYPFPLPLTEGDYHAWSRWSEAEHRAHAAEIASLREGHVALAVPLLAKNEIAGLLLLGPPEGREAYGDTEKRVLQNCAGQFALMIENARLTDRIVEQEKLRRDMQLAIEVQKRLLPEKPPATAGISLAGMSIPARGVGGDYYDFLDLGDRRIGIALADVAGKGVAAALIMSVVQASLRIIAVEDISLAEVAARMNRYLNRSTKSNAYATFFYACVEEERRVLRYVNAGHNPPYLLRRNAAGAVEELPAGGTVIGLFPQMSYTEAAIDLAPGDVLMAFTDGVPEAQSPAEEEFGEERIREMLARLAPLDVNAIATQFADELKAWIAGADQYDDLTFILLKVDPDLKVDK
jgi:serine phosphatase RsbU (regulator of sigma subunit)